MRHPVRSLIVTTLAAVATLALSGGTARAAPTTYGHSLFCQATAFRDHEAIGFPAYCRSIAAALRSNGQFSAALANAHRVDATILFTALPDGRIVAALFVDGTGHMVIDRGLMNALQPVRYELESHHAQTFLLPIGLQVVDNTPVAVYRLRNR
ncbi:hypothetical protein AiwAL_07805 [Acidiphilium sp. AL]|uniref:Uncharacterized protein n=1 Tax=Acidiphilium iwatense TaxID=768198 RepID=A0ABS9DWW5_9PROT|nr:MULTISPECIES: hypothetical protein [Acidiphilium]MCF3946685.1 hypothetical protein [Acidiphilium iwatense]MCU4160010.1 hypothetical protein [Acidiphilium sp. AL]